MYTFTAGGKGRGVYTKLRLINEIKSYVTYLIANSTAEIYFFSNIEIGHKLSNPHLHTQIWSDDLNAVEEIYERVIKKFELKSKRCSLSEPQRCLSFYDYVIKDYSKDLNDDEVWNLEQTKKRMRKTLGLKMRFYSRSKSKYTSKLYRMVYHTYGILRAMADSFIEFMLETFFVRKGLRETLLQEKKQKNILAISSFITIKNKGVIFFCMAFVMLCYAFVISILFYSPAMSPPLLRTVGSDCLVYFNIRRFIMGVWIVVVSLIVFVVVFMCCSPPVLVLILGKN